MALRVPRQLPFLEAICWQTEDLRHLTPQEMLQRYERGWHYLQVLGELDDQEKTFVNALARRYGSWLGSMVHLQQHQLILRVLAQISMAFFQKCQIYFGGDTLLTLTHAEYRLSRDIDFLCSNLDGYRELRRAIFARSYGALFQNPTDLTFPREIQANQYGIRFPVVLKDQTIRFEIVSEGRIKLGPPESLPYCPVCLNTTDRGAEKLLANSDRWPDTSVCSRDLIDLAILRLHEELTPTAFAKAEAAYPVLEPLQEAIAAFQQKPSYRERCYQALQVKSPRHIIEGFDLLATDLGGGVTERTAQESS